MATVAIPEEEVATIGVPSPSSHHIPVNDRASAISIIIRQLPYQFIGARKPRAVRLVPPVLCMATVRTVIVLSDSARAKYTCCWLRNSILLPCGDCSGCRPLVVLGLSVCGLQLVQSCSSDVSGRISSFPCQHSPSRTDSSQVYCTLLFIQSSREAEC